MFFAGVKWAYSPKNRIDHRFRFQVKFRHAWPYPLDKMRWWIRYAGHSIIVAAAKGLNITRSAVSQHLKKLEDEIKTQLFTRLHKRLVPTVAADRLFAIMDPFYKELQSGLQVIKRAKIRPSGLLRIGAPVEFGKAYFPGIFASFRLLYPEVTFFLKLGDPEVLLAGLIEGGAGLERMVPASFRQANHQTKDRVDRG